MSFNKYLPWHKWHLSYSRSSCFVLISWPLMDSKDLMSFKKQFSSFSPMTFPNEWNFVKFDMSTKLNSPFREPAVFIWIFLLFFPSSTSQYDPCMEQHCLLMFIKETFSLLSYLFFFILFYFFTSSGILQKLSMLFVFNVWSWVELFSKALFFMLKTCLCFFPMLKNSLLICIWKTT